MHAPEIQVDSDVVWADVMQATIAYTDGSSTGGRGPGGWAYAVLDRCSCGRTGCLEGQVTIEGSGGAQGTTNQRMELQAAHEAVLAISGPLLVVSDSAYVVNCFRDRWYVKWNRTDYRKVSNRDLWEPFIDHVLNHAGEVRFAWVKGHSGHRMNNYVDAAAKAARKAVTA